MARLPREKKVDCRGKTKRGKGTKLMVLADGNGISVAIDIASDNRAEVNLIEPLIDSVVAEHVPPRLIYDKAADSGKLRDRLAEPNIDLISPHRKGRVNPPKKDRRKLKCYKR